MNIKIKQEKQDNSLYIHTYIGNEFIGTISINPNKQICVSTVKDNKVKRLNDRKNNISIFC